MITDDEYLERLVAGLLAVTAPDADVVWNEQINGRQFDVAMRFQNGPFRFLVLVEVKNRTRKAAASDLEAFVLKARDQNANKAVFVTAAGFQAGAVEVAKRHGVDLFTVTFDDTQPMLPVQASMVVLSKPGVTPPKTASFQLGEPSLMANIESLDLVFTDGSRASLPTERSQMSYYAARTVFADGASLKDLVATQPIYKIAEGQRIEKTIKLKPSRKIAPPDDYFFPGGKLRAIEVSIVGRMGRRLTGNILIEPDIFTSPVIYSNVLTGEVHSFHTGQLPLNFETVQEHQFYLTDNPLRYYYSYSISGGLVRWLIVESFQADELIQADISQKIEFGRYMIPVRHGPTLVRLRRRLADVEKRMTPS